MPHSPPSLPSHPGREDPVHPGRGRRRSPAPAALHRAGRAAGRGRGGQRGLLPLQRPGPGPRGPVPGGRPHPVLPGLGPGSGPGPGPGLAGRGVILGAVLCPGSYHLIFLFSIVGR